MGFLGFANVYAMRVNLSVAIVAMVNHTAIPKIADNITECPIPSSLANETFILVRYQYFFYGRIFTIFFIYFLLYRLTFKLYNLLIDTDIERW